jgi:hypothetical protein
VAVPDQDPLRTALTELRDAALPHVIPPGVGAVRRRVRQTRTVRVVAAALAVAAVLGGLIGISALRRPALPAQPRPTRLAPTITVVTPTATPSPAVSSSPTATATTTAGGHNGVGGSGGSGGPVGSGGPGGSGGCVPEGYVAPTTGRDSTGATVITLDANAYFPLCPGETVRAFWVQYKPLPDGSQIVDQSGEFRLTQTNPTATFSFYVPSCSGVFVMFGGDSPGIGDSAIVQDIPPGAPDPYPGYSVQARGGQAGFLAGSCNGVMVGFGYTPPG